ncbi:MAG: adenosine deaminase [Acidimicrobiia bacterium]
MRDFESMPKVELHVHLEGAIPRTSLWALVEQAGGDPDVPNLAALEHQFRFRDFDHFIDTWVWKNRFLDSYEAFEVGAEAAASELAAQNVVYAEAFFSPSDFSQFGLAPAELALAIRRGLDRADGVQVALIVDVVRDTGPERASDTFEEIREVAESAGIIGVGLGGSEADFPPELFADVYRRARDAGFRLTAHAGEVSGPDSVLTALSVLGVERIGHGIRSVEDRDLLKSLVEHQIPLEVCPSSNLATGLVPSWEEHPIRQLIDAGAMVTLSTDDPAMFATTLSGEYRTVATRYGYDDMLMRQLAQNAVEASWTDTETRLQLQQELDLWWDR